MFFQPGTYDSLAHMFFGAIPTPGSSGGPIVDIETGSVVGLIRGSRLDNRVQGLRGWATSSESIYEVRNLLPSTCHASHVNIRCSGYLVYAPEISFCEHFRSYYGTG